MKYLSATIIALGVIASPAHAATDDMLAAALKRIEALESKTDRLVDENKQLRQELNKTRTIAAKPQSKYENEKLTVGANEKKYLGRMEPISANDQLIREANWQGVYGGLNAGYGIGEVAGYSKTLGNTLGYGIQDSTNYLIAGGSGIYSGPVAGGQIGYNKQFANNILLGIEADFNYSDVNNKSGGSAYNNYFMQASNTAFYSNNQNYRTSLDWIGTIRARTGYALGNFFPFITAGFAYGNIATTNLTSNAQISMFTSTTSVGSAFTSNSISEIKTGWAVGAGAEYQVAKNWSVKGEYLYTQLGGISGYGFNGAVYSSLSSGTPTRNSGAAVTYVYLGSFGVHQARVGLNYHTGWLGGANAVTVKY